MTDGGKMGVAEKMAQAFARDAAERAKALVLDGAELEIRDFSNADRLGYRFSDRMREEFKNDAKRARILPNNLG